MDFRIGQGYDTHKMAEGNNLILGGVQIESEKGCVAHSDGDVLLHALTDALLGSIAAGDIGELFPDSNPANRNRCSKEFVIEAMKWLTIAKYKVKNIDATIILEAPKLSPYKEKIKHNIAGLCDIFPDHVNIKARTNEKLDAIGEGRGIMAQVVVLVYRNN